MHTFRWHISLIHLLTCKKHIKYYRIVSSTKKNRLSRSQFPLIFSCLYDFSLSFAHHLLCNHSQRAQTDCQPSYQIDDHNLRPSIFSIFGHHLTFSSYLHRSFSYRSLNPQFLSLKYFRSMLL